MPKSRNPKIEFDKLQLYFAEPYVIDLDSAIGSITMTQPTIGDVVRIGEARFYGTLNVFVTNTTAHRLMLWEAGLDWNVLSDFELFTGMIEGADKEVYQLFFKDLDLSKFERLGKNVGDKQVLVLYDAEDEIEINEEVYWHISQYLRNIFNIFPEEKITSSGVLKQWYIDADIRQRAIDKEKAAKGKLEQSSSIQSVISAYINHPGTKYKLKELKEVGVCEFWDSVQRLQVYEQTTACLKGLYSGMVDGSKVKPESYNFMKEMKHEDYGTAVKNAEDKTNSKTKPTKKKKK